MTAARTAIETADWRRRVFGIYDEVRRMSIHDPRDAHRYWREARDELFATHAQTPLLPDDRAGFTGLPVAEYDAAWRFEVQLEEPASPARFDFETGTDGVVPFELVGRAVVPGVGSLDVWRLKSYGGGLFVPVRDALGGRAAATGGADARGEGSEAATGSEADARARGEEWASTARTYGGGRYLLDTIKGAHLGEGAAPGSLVLDFNFAYNPSCAYDPAWACPLAPAGNRVAAEIPVGELYP